MQIKLNDITIKWDLEKGTCTFENLPVAMMWIDTTLAGLMSGLQNMVGAKRFNLALQGEGRNSVDADWEVFMEFPKFEDGFKAIANIAAVAGWGNWQLITLEEIQKKCCVRVKDSWEGLYQKALGVCWGSGMVAGKMAGYCSKLFGTNCWAEQTKFIAKGDDYDEFLISPSVRSIEEEIEKLLTTDEATKADMAVALTKLRNEVMERKSAQESLVKSQEELKKSKEKYKEAFNRAEFYKDLFAHDINNILQSILLSSQMLNNLLKDIEEKTEIEKILDIFQEQVFRGSKLVENVQKLSQLEVYETKLGELDIKEVIINSIRTLKNNFPNKQIEIQFKIPQKNYQIKANELIYAVFENILINSVKYNRNKVIEIDINLIQEDLDDNKYIKIELIDNGIGIEDNRKTLIFQRVYNREQKVGGMGLGLSLVQKIIESYNGKIWVENKIKDNFSKGTKFILLIPEVC